MTSYFCIPVPYNEKDIFFWVLVLRGLVSLHRIVQLHLLQHYWLGHHIDLDYCDIECFALERYRDYSVVFETAGNYYILVEMEMATHSNILALKIPWTVEPGGLWFVGL